MSATDTLKGVILHELGQQAKLGADKIAQELPDIDLGINLSEIDKIRSAYEDYKQSIDPSLSIGTVPIDPDLAWKHQVKLNGNMAGEISCGVDVQIDAMGLRAPEFKDVQAGCRGRLRF